MMLKIPRSGTAMTAAGCTGQKCTSPTAHEVTATAKGPKPDLHPAQGGQATAVFPPRVGQRLVKSQAQPSKEPEPKPPTPR